MSNLVTMVIKSDGRQQVMFDHSKHFFDKHITVQAFYQILLRSATHKRNAGSIENIKSLTLSSGVILVSNGIILDNELKEWWESRCAENQ